MPENTDTMSGPKQVKRVLRVNARDLRDEIMLRDLDVVVEHDREVRIRCAHTQRTPTLLPRAKPSFFSVQQHGHVRACGKFFGKRCCRTVGKCDDDRVPIAREVRGP